jgi:phage recombination protein Bet
MNELVTTSGNNAVQGYTTPEQIELIKNTVAKGATNDELAMFLTIANKYQLDPFLKEIWFIKRAKKVQDNNGQWNYKRLPSGEIDYSGAETTIYSSRDGYLKIAQRDPNFDGIASCTVYEKDDFQISPVQGEIKHTFAKGNRGAIIGAYAVVLHKNRKPCVVYVPFLEYNDAKSTTWQKYPSAMIIKVAEVFALKRQFAITGLLAVEEKELEPEFKKLEKECIEDVNAIVEAKPINTTPAPKLLTNAERKAICDEANKAGISNAVFKELLISNEFCVNSTSEITQDKLPAIRELINSFTNIEIMEE